MSAKIWRGSIGCQKRFGTRGTECWDRFGGDRMPVEIWRGSDISRDSEGIECQESYCVIGWSGKILRGRRSGVYLEGSNFRKYSEGSNAGRYSGGVG